MRRREFSLLLGGALSVMPFIAAGTSKEASLQAPVNLLKVFSYIVPESWVRAPGLAALIWRKLAPDIYVVLVQELDGMVATVVAWILPAVPSLDRSSVVRVVRNRGKHNASRKASK